MKQKTIYDVAKEAGVSISTVSRVINGTGNVKEETRKRVELACANYRPAASARELQAKCSKTIGVVVNHNPEYFFLNSTYMNALLAISVVAKANKYRLLLDISDEDKEICNLYYERKVDGFIMMGAKKSSELIKTMKANDIPFVLIGSYHGDEKNVCQVDINDKMAIENVMNYLVRLGHQRIGIITGSLEYASCADRLEGYLSILEKNNIPIRKEYIQICDGLTEVKAEQLAKNMLYQAEPVTAIVCFNDSVAMAVYKAAKDCGLQIPKQLSVVGFDDTQVAQYMSPTLTSVWQPSYEKGEKAMQILLDCLKTDTLPTEIYEQKCITMYRESCASVITENK